MEPSRLEFLTLVGYNVVRYALTSSVQSANALIGAIFSPLGRLELETWCCDQCLRTFSDSGKARIKRLKTRRRWFWGVTAVGVLSAAGEITFMVNNTDPYRSSHPGVQFFMFLFVLPVVCFLVGYIGIKLAREGILRTKWTTKEDWLAKSAQVQRRLAEFGQGLDIGKIYVPLGPAEPPRFIRGVSARPAQSSELLFVPDQNRDWGTIKGDPKCEGLYAVAYDEYGGRTWYRTYDEPQGVSCNPSISTFASRANTPYNGWGTVGDGGRCAFKYNSERFKNMTHSSRAGA
jgi:hypothetical protein